jgi:hypothetical protein
MRAQGLERGDLLPRLEHAALELDRLETELRAHRLRLRDNAIGIKRGALAGGAPAFRPRVGAESKFTACAFVFIKQIRRIGHALTHDAAQQHGHGYAEGLARNVETGDVERALDLHERTLVPRLVAARSHGLGAEAHAQGRPQRMPVERIAADGNFPRGF